MRWVIPHNDGHSRHRKPGKLARRRALRRDRRSRREVKARAARKLAKERRRAERALLEQPKNIGEGEAA